MCSNCLNHFCDKYIQKWENNYNFYYPFQCEYPKYYTNLTLKNMITLISEFKNKIKANFDVDKNNNDKEQYKSKDEYIIDYQDKIIQKLMEEKNNLKITVNVLLEENKILLLQNKEMQYYKDNKELEIKKN